VEPDHLHDGHLGAVALVAPPPIHGWLIAQASPGAPRQRAFGGGCGARSAAAARAGPARQPCGCSIHRWRCQARRIARWALRVRVGGERRDGGQRGVVGLLVTPPGSAGGCCLELSASSRCAWSRRDQVPALPGNWQHRPHLISCRAVSARAHITTLAPLRHCDQQTCTIISHQRACLPAPAPPSCTTTH
jgi:hypothetical protein